MGQLSIVLCLCFMSIIIIGADNSTLVFEQYTPMLEKLKCKLSESEEVDKVLTLPLRECTNLEQMMENSERAHVSVFCDIIMNALLELLCDPHMEATYVAKWLLNHANKMPTDHLCMRVSKVLTTPVFCSLCHTQLCQLFLWVYDTTIYLHSKREMKSVTQTNLDHSANNGLGNNAKLENVPKPFPGKETKDSKGSEQIKEELNTEYDLHNQVDSKNISEVSQMVSETGSQNSQPIDLLSITKVNATDDIVHTEAMKKSTVSEIAGEINQDIPPSQISQNTKSPDEIEKTIPEKPDSPTAPPTTYHMPEAVSESEKVESSKEDDTNAGSSETSFMNESDGLKTIESDHTKLAKSEEDFSSDLSVDYVGSGDNSHFYLYFCCIVGVALGVFILFRNKQKIIAFIVEGKHERRRRPSTVAYKKLDTK